MNISKKEIDALVKCAENVNYFSKYVQIITAKVVQNSNRILIRENF